MSDNNHYVYLVRAGPVLARAQARHRQRDPAQAQAQDQARLVDNGQDRS